MKMKEGNWNVKSDAFAHQSEVVEDCKKKKQRERDTIDRSEDEEDTFGQYRHVKRKYSHMKQVPDNSDESMSMEDSEIVEKNQQVSDNLVASDVFKDECRLEKNRLTQEAEQTKRSVAEIKVEEKIHRGESMHGPTFEEQKSPLYSDRTKDLQQVKGRQPQWRKDDREVNLSFCGCGFLGIYHVGVASCFHQYAPQLSMQKISGSSAGALVAMAHICGDLQLAYCTTDILAIAIEARSHALGSFHPSFDIQAQVRESLERGLPEDAYLKASGKLHVSLTRVEDGENVIVSEFESNEDLIQVLLCSCFIPFWSGIRLPKYKDVAYIDGGFSNNLLILNEKTVTVSPFAGEADICPQDDTLNLLQISLSNTSFSISPSNLYRVTHALLPPEPEILSDLCKQGFADGIRYLQRMNLISCTKCLEIRSSLLVTTDGEDIEEVFSSASKPTTTVQDYHHQQASPASSGDLIVLEQQEQEMIEIVEPSRTRRGSVVSISSSHRLHHSSSGRQQSTNDGNNNLTPAVSLYNLLNGIELEDNIDGYSSTGDCNECVLIRERALYDPLPKLFSDRIREASDKVNKSLSRWIYSHRPVKYLSYLIAPYYIPVDLTLAIIYRFWKKLPIIRAEVSDCLGQVLDFLVVMLKRMQTRSTSAMLMGFGDSWQEDELAYEKECVKQRKQEYHHQRRHRTSTTLAPTIAAAAQQQHSSGQAAKELHSLEDTFDSIVDVTSNQEARILAYYFRDAKNRLQVTEIFDLERASSVSADSASIASLQTVASNCGQK